MTKNVRPHLSGFEKGMNMMNECRQYWVDMLTKIAEPVLVNFKNRTLHKNLVIETRGVDREKYKGLEILGRTISGLAPWLETPAENPEEEKKRQYFAELTREALDAATDPESPDFCTYSTGDKVWNQQWAVDVAYVALAIMRAPHELYEKLDERVKDNLANCFYLTRNIRVPYNNWILFQATTETALYTMGRDYDVVRIDYAIRQMEQWYAGDGYYDDGPSFALDYYNSFVIQPMLTVVVDKFWKTYIEKHQNYSSDEEIGNKIYRLVMKRFKRFARIQEMQISPDGSYPATGRSIVYRGGAFQALAQAALWDMLPDEVTPAMARVALTRVIKKTLEPENTFRADGFLNIGVTGHQPTLAEGYITTASVYMTTLAFLPLGLPESHPFWSSPDEMTSWEKIFGGVDMPGDHAPGGDVKLY